MQLLEEVWGFQDVRAVGAVTEIDGGMFVDVKCSGDCPLCGQVGGHESNNYSLSYFKAKGGQKRKRAGEGRGEQAANSQREGGEGDSGCEEEGVPGGAAMYVKSFAASCREKRTDLFNTEEQLPLPGLVSKYVHALTSHRKADQCHADYADAYAENELTDMVSYRPTHKCYQYQQEGGYWKELVDSTAFCLMGRALAPMITRQGGVVKLWAVLGKV
jgi:hypothetical protein